LPTFVQKSLPYVTLVSKAQVPMRNMLGTPNVGLNDVAPAVADNVTNKVTQ